MQQQHIMQRHSHYAMAAYHAAALSAKRVTAAYHAMQHSKSCNGSISCSGTLIMQQQHIMQCSTLNHAMAAYHAAAFSMR